MNMKKKVLVISIVSAIVVLALIIGSYFFFFYKVQCDTKECFLTNLVDCKRTAYTNADAQTITQYTILGTSAGKCETNVKIIQVKQGALEVAVLEGKEMNCFTGIGIGDMPEKNIENCHGELKEQIQSIIIDRLYSQILQNIGKIGEETSQVL